MSTGAALFDPMKIKWSSSIYSVWNQVKLLYLFRSILTQFVLKHLRWRTSIYSEAPWMVQLYLLRSRQSETVLFVPSLYNSLYKVVLSHSLSENLWCPRRVLVIERYPSRCFDHKISLIVPSFINDTAVIKETISIIIIIINRQINNSDLEKGNQARILFKKIEILNSDFQQNMDERRLSSSMQSAELTPFQMLKIKKIEDKIASSARASTDSPTQSPLSGGTCS